jgi:hypothetical protein
MKKDPVVRTSISIPTSLKKRMDGVSEDVNWSEVALEAFASKCDQIDKKKEARAMQDTINQLRASLKEEASSQYRAGEKSGATWVRKKAMSPQLLRLKKCHDEAGYDWGRLFDMSAYTVAEEVFSRIEGMEGNPDRTEAARFWESVCGNTSPEDDFVQGFVEGALALLDKAKGKVKGKP